MREDRIETLGVERQHGVHGKQLLPSHLPRQIIVQILLRLYVELGHGTQDVQGRPAVIDCLVQGRLVALEIYGTVLKFRLLQAEPVQFLLQNRLQPL